MQSLMQSVLQPILRSGLRLVYPPACLSCGDPTEVDHALCGPCWRDTPFITGLTCDACGTPLPGDSDTPVLCDDCMTTARPWAQGRAVMGYAGRGRQMVLRLKHGDRTDLAPALGRWLAQSAAPVMTPDMIVVPVPLHRARLFRRRFNQAALLSHALSRAAGLDHAPNALIRPTATKPLEGHGKEARFRALDGAIRPHPRHGAQLSGRPVLLVDDVMTSGATLSAATQACHAAGATRVCIAALARVVKAP